MPFHSFAPPLYSHLISRCLSTWDIEAIKTGVQKKAGPANLFYMPPGIIPWNAERRAEAEKKKLWSVISNSQHILHWKYYPWVEETRRTLFSIKPSTFCLHHLGHTHMLHPSSIMFFFFYLLTLFCSFLHYVGTRCTPYFYSSLRLQNVQMTYRNVLLENSALKKQSCVMQFYLIEMCIINKSTVLQWQRCDRVYLRGYFQRLSITQSLKGLCNAAYKHYFRVRVQHVCRVTALSYLNHISRSHHITLC